MTKSSFFWILSVFISIPTLVFPQTINTEFGGSQLGDLILTTDLEHFSNRNMSYDQIKGTPYNNNTFKISDIYFEDGSISKGLHSRLDLYNGNVEIIVNNEIMALRDPQSIRRVNYKNESYLYISKDQYEGLSGFYKVYYEGETMLVGSSKVNFKEATAVSNNYTEPQPQRFEKQKEKLYFKLRDNIYYDTSNRRKLYSKLLEYNYDAYLVLKQNRVKLNNTSSLIDFLKIIESKS